MALICYAISEIDMDMIINMLSIIVTVASMVVTIIYAGKAHKYKSEIYNKIEYIDIKDFMNRFNQISLESSRVQNGSNNNRGGKLDTLFNHINETMGYVPLFASRLENKEVAKKLNDMMKSINQIVINNRNQATVDVVVLYNKISDMNVIVQLEFLSLLQKIEKK